jgi:hypothetical protein
MADDHHHSALLRHLMPYMFKPFALHKAQNFAHRKAREMHARGNIPSHARETFSTNLASLGSRPLLTESNLQIPLH